MKLITERALEGLENELDCMITNDRFCMTLHLTWMKEEQYKFGIAELDKRGIKYHKASGTRTVHIKQLALVDKVKMSEERVWLTTKGEVAVLTSEMDHQRLSNCIHLFEVFMKAGKLSKSQGEEYLLRLNEGVGPELAERFKGDLLPYKPHFAWEKELLKEAGMKAK
jgi:hypothetical protein